MKHANLLFVGITVLLLLALTSAGYGLPLQESIPTPAEFHGYELGTTYTITANLYEYYKELARRSSRVEYHEYGRSIHGRPLSYLLIGSEKRLAAKDEYLDRIRKLTQSLDPLAPSELNSLIEDTPAFVSIFIVDTDEEAGVEVLQEIAYDLATREDESARSDGYKGILEVENLRRYVRGGGTLIAVQGAAEVVATDEVLGADVEFEGWAEYTNGPTLRARWEIPIDAGVETTTWQPGLDEAAFPLLAFGYQKEEFAVPGAYPVLFTVSEKGRARAVARYSSDERSLLMDGYMAASDKEKLAGRPFVVIQRVGRGKVIYFACDPTFRGYWYGLNLLFLNSLILGPVL